VVDDTPAKRRRLGLPDRYGSRHTATVAGYVLEGHVPAAAVKRLLAARPKALGLAVLGMPLSAPGMDIPGRKDPYDVADHRHGRTIQGLRDLSQVVHGLTLLAD
jgi:hypothetical protein